MDKTYHLMAEKNESNKDSQKGQVTPKKYLKNNMILVVHAILLSDKIRKILWVWQMPTCKCVTDFKCIFRSKKLMVSSFQR